MGRAAAIAYAREGADVAINYFPTEQPDADEVVSLIKEAGRKAVALPGDLAHLGEGRVLVRYRKLKPTPARFPRRVGLARSQPILVPGAGPTPTHGSQSRQE